MRGAAVLSLALALALACRAASGDVPDPRAGEAALHDCLARTWEPETCIGAVRKSCEAGFGRDGLTTAGMGTCLTAEAAAWQRILDAEHADLLGFWQAQASGPDTAEALARLAGSQDSFAAYREDWCGYQAMTGGSIATVLAAACWAETTAARAIGLLWQTRGMGWQPECGGGACGE